ncbi:MAG TPA: hypothetical protein VKA60_23425 [Blastocatellia bacterium]|nr:hypothetical protein [Blastocatellia bacterium]
MFHSSSFIGAPVEEAEAIDLLHEFSLLPEIEAIDTQPGPLPYIEIPEYDLSYGKTASVSVTLKGKDFPMKYELEVYDTLWSIAAEISNQYDLGNPETVSAFREVLLEQAHGRLRSDILVSLSPRLLAHRAMSALQRANIRSPLETAKIVGLFLRARDNYTLRVSRRGKIHTNSGGFFDALARYKMPNLWRFSSACSHSRRFRSDDTPQLGRSIFMRCAWALEARDAVGRLFYGLHNNTNRDAMMYHFNYLTLLLLGAFDAQARIAKRAYKVIKPDERHASFSNDSFLNALLSKGAISLHSIVSSQWFKDLMIMLKKLRNTIHGSVFPMVFSDQESFVIVMRDYQKEMWDAGQRIGPPERWGLIKDAFMQFEPYTYACTLVEECLGQIDMIAAEIDIDGLFPAGYAVPPFDDDSDKDGPFNASTRRRLVLLG